MRWMGLIVVLGGIMMGCASKPEEMHGAATTLAGKHRLVWEAYDGTGDAERAVFVLDGEHIGRGKLGLRVLQDRMRRMPRDSRIYIGIYYGDAGGSVRRRYPFDEAELVRWAEEHGVVLMVPAAG